MRYQRQHTSHPHPHPQTHTCECEGAVWCGRSQSPHTRSTATDGRVGEILNIALTTVSKTIVKSTRPVQCKENSHDKHMPSGDGRISCVFGEAYMYA